MICIILKLKSTKPDKSSPKIVEKKDDYVRVEYESPILGVSKSLKCFKVRITQLYTRHSPRPLMNNYMLLQLVDDVEFWFPPGKKSIVQYRAASRLGNYDFDANRKRIKVWLYILLSTFCYSCSFQPHLSHWLMRSYKTGAEIAIREKGMGIRRHSLNGVIFTKEHLFFTC